MKKSVLRRILLILVFLVFPLPLVAVSVLPVGKVEYEFVYDRLERAEALSLDYYPYQLGPYNGDEQWLSFGPFEYLRRLPPQRLVLFSFAGEDFSSAKDRSARGFEFIRGGLAACPFGRMFVYGNFLLDERKAEDENYTGKKWRGLAGGVEEAFVYYRTNPLEITVGRFASFWGPRNSLALTPNGAMDGLGYTVHWGRLALSYRLARLDGLNPDKDSVAQFENRYFVGHRLDVYLSRTLRLGVFETTVFGGPGRQIDLYYLNPIIFFHSSQLNEGMNDNTFLGFDFSFKPRSGCRLYGQLLVDDFQIDKDSQGDQEPDQYGMILGAHIVNLWRSVDLKLEYSRVANWTFNQTLVRNRYLMDGHLIGGALGNDYDRLELNVTRWVGDDMAVSLGFTSLRQGEGRVTDEWTAPWLETDGDYSEPFPTGTVETTRTFSVGFKGFLFDHFYIGAESGIDRVNNYLHADSDDRSLPYVRLNVSTFFSSSLSIERE